MSTDETRIDRIPLPGDDRQPGRARALILIVVLLLFVGLAATQLGSGSDPADEQASPPEPAAAEDLEPVPTTTLDDSAGDPSSGEEPPAPAEPPAEQPAAPEPPAPEPPAEEPEPEPADPCDVLAEGHTLLVTPDPLVLPEGDLSSQVMIHNCGDESVDWSAQTVPWVTLQAPAGTLAAGASIDLNFFVDESELDGGVFGFTIKVSEPGANTYVDVSGTTPVIQFGG